MYTHPASSKFLEDSYASSSGIWEKQNKIKGKGKVCGRDTSQKDTIWVQHGKITIGAT